MAKRIGKDNSVDYGAFSTSEDDVRSPQLTAVPAPAEESAPAPDTDEPAPSQPAAKSAAKAPAGRKAPARKSAPQRPPIPASQPPLRVKVAIPPEIHAEMHTAVNAWLAEDPQRMYDYNSILGTENTFLVTMLAYGAAKFKEEHEAKGGASVTFPDYIPPNKRKGK